MDHLLDIFQIRTEIVKNVSFWRVSQLNKGFQTYGAARIGVEVQRLNTLLKFYRYETSNCSKYITVSTITVTLSTVNRLKLFKMAVVQLKRQYIVNLISLLHHLPLEELKTWFNAKEKLHSGFPTDTFYLKFNLFNSDLIACWTGRPDPRRHIRK